MDGVHLLVLWSFAVVQPSLEVVSNGADFFVVRGVAGLDLLFVVVALTLLPPAVLFGLEALAGRVSEHARQVLHLLLMCGFATLLVLSPLSDAFPTSGWWIVGAALAAGIGATAAYTRFGPLRSIVTVLAPAPLVFLIAFFLFSPAKSLLLPGEEAAVVDAAPSETPVVLIVLDELPVTSIMDREGRVDAGRFPAFGRLAREATWFRNTTAAADGTVAAVPALLTGRRPSPDSLPILSDHPQNIFTLLGGSHDVEAMEHATLLCPHRLCPSEGSRLRRMASLASALSLVYAHVVVPEGLRLNLPTIGSSWGEAVRARNPERDIDPDTAERAELMRHGVPQFEKFLRAIEPPPRGADRPPFYFFHSSLPHYPWKYLPSGKVYVAFSEWEPTTWDDRQVVATIGWQRHLLQVELADRLLGEAIRRLRDAGLYDRALVAVVSDHGGSFRAGQKRRAVESSNAADVGMVPFFLKAPRQRRGKVVDRHLQTIDVLPTIADVLGTDMPWRVDGTSAYRMKQPGRRRVTISAAAGGDVTLATSSIERLRRRTLGLQTSLFGRTPHDRGLFGIGPWPRLHGRSLVTLRVTPDPGKRLELKQAERYASVDPDSPFIPALVSGRVAGIPEHSRPGLAIAVNGRIWSTTRSVSFFREGGYFTAMVPERAFKAGRNDVEVLPISGRGRDVTLLRPSAG